MTRPRSKPIEAPADSSVNDEVERVTRHLRAENESDKTVVTYREAVDQLLHHLTDRGMPTTPEHIRREHVEAFIVSLLERFKLAAASARYRALQVFFEWLVEEDVIETSPMVHMKPPKVPEQPAPALSIAELKALVATCEKGRSFEDRRDPALLRVFIDTGARLSEVAGLRFDLAQDSASGCGRFVGLRYALAMLPDASRSLALASPSLGSSLSDLVTPCGDSLRPAIPPDPPGRQALGLTLSGGGFRATLAALGVVRCLADLDLLRDVRYVSSVSGGSITNGQLAIVWPKLRASGFSPAAVDVHLIEPIVRKVSTEALTRKLVRNAWRLATGKNRTEVLAWAFDDWWYGGARIEGLDPECRWIINAANLTTGVRFAFERDVLGDYVLGLTPTAGAGIRLSLAVAASAAVPGAFARVRLRGLPFPCARRGDPQLLDGGAYDNTGLEALDSSRYRDLFTVSINAGGAFVTGRLGRLPVVGDLQRANSMLYRQSTGLRTRWMVDRFRAFELAPDDPPLWGREGVLFGLASTIGAGAAPGGDRFDEWAATYPEHRTWRDEDLAFVPTVFDRLDLGLCQRLVYRGWWLTGATIARYHSMKLTVPIEGITPPAIDAPER